MLPVQKILMLMSVQQVLAPELRPVQEVKEMSQATTEVETMPQVYNLW
jgi:hypothetical protein